MTLYLALGIRKATSTVIAHPALIMTPIFSFWTFGPVKSGGCCAYRRSEPKICLSFRLTWFNAVLTFCGTFGLVVAYEAFIKTEYSWSLNGVISPYDPVLFLFLIAFLPLFAFAVILLLLIQFMEKCSCCCCCCSKDECYPMTEKVVHDTENPVL